MRVVLLTREYPPDVYGGAGVHVEYLARELARITDVEVRCFGADRDGALAFRPPAELADTNAALQTMALDPARVHVILNGIDSKQYSPDLGTEAVERFGVDPGRPSVVFVGRITRQKGISHLLEAALAFDPSAQIVLAAAAPDTEALAGE